MRSRVPVVDGLRMARDVRRLLLDVESDPDDLTRLRLIAALREVLGGGG